MALHRILEMRRSYISCACGDWSLKLDKSCTLHGQARADHLMDSFLRHAAEEMAKTAKEAPQGVAE